MSIGAPAAADVPRLFDVIINGKGYIFLRTIDTSLPFRTQRAKYSSTPTFLERTNVSGSYGDNQQDFFLTGSQNDWSGGDGQRFFRPDDVQSKDRFYVCSNMDISIPGQATLMPDVRALTFAAAVNVVGSSTTTVYAASSTNLYSVSVTGAITDLGAHGCGGQPSTMAYDGNGLFLSGAGNVRRFDIGGGTFSTFSATSVSPMCYVSNTMFGQASTGFGYFDTAGTFNLAFPRKDAPGTTLGNAANRMVAFGGQAAFLHSSQVPGGAELWIGSTTGASRIAEFPPNFSASDMVENLGIIYIVGIEYNGTIGQRTAIYYFANGSIGKLYSSPKWTTTGLGGLGITAWNGGVIFTDGVTATLKIYDPATGATRSVSAWTMNASALYLQNLNSALTYGMAVNGTTSGTLFFHSTSVATTGTISSSLIDFDNALTKLMRSVKVDWISATDGNGGSVDISYQVDGLDGAYTSLQVGAVSGTEYLIPGNVTGRAISVKLTLNKGTSTLGPTLKRVYVRAAPVLQSYRNCEYMLDCSGVDGKTPVILNDDDTAHPLDGLAQATNLRAAIASGTPVSVTDRFGTYTAYIEPAQSELIEVSPEEYIGRIFTREV